MSDRFQETRRSLDQRPRPRPGVSLWPKREGALQLAILALTLTAGLCLAAATVLLPLPPPSQWPYPGVTAAAGVVYLWLALRGTARLQERRRMAARQRDAAR